MATPGVEDWLLRLRVNSFTLADPVSGIAQLDIGVLGRWPAVFPFMRIEHTGSGAYTVKGIIDGAVGTPIAYTLGNWNVFRVQHDYDAGTTEVWIDGTSLKTGGPVSWQGNFAPFMRHAWQAAADQADWDFGPFWLCHDGSVLAEYDDLSEILDYTNTGAPNGKPRFWQPAGNNPLNGITFNRAAGHCNVVSAAHSSPNSNETVYRGAQNGTDNQCRTYYAVTTDDTGSVHGVRDYGRGIIQYDRYNVQDAAWEGQVDIASGSYPSLCRLADGALICVFEQGTVDPTSPTGTTPVMEAYTSTDNGATWLLTA